MIKFIAESELKRKYNKKIVDSLNFVQKLAIIITSVSILNVIMLQ